MHFPGNTIKIVKSNGINFGNMPSLDQTVWVSFLAKYVSFVFQRRKNSRPMLDNCIIACFSILFADKLKRDIGK
ncbi:hypothetical protein Echvi_4007 [Echinicola vietnamensis DSM 17526]|uniref:Uncharacterized protein n=1 Tax=Echinicola vietnamensis (strain DSM 17526 / LMG 23754 / KMM 6221) TaxID=926556 RepID=L0G1W7_ECHVK|nr:hypothetical protein Echvi_4007 [Echinicola vietnamensis DSM 17526]